LDYDSWEALTQRESAFMLCENLARAIELRPVFVVGTARGDGQFRNTSPPVRAAFPFIESDRQRKSNNRALHNADIPATTLHQSGVGDALGP
jgi:hypothetical protein